MAVAELIVSRRVLLGATLAIPMACVASPRNDGAALSPGQRDGGPIMGSSPSSSLHPGEGRGPDDYRDGNWIPDQRAAQPLRGNGEQHSRKTAQSPAVTKWNRALARFRHAEAALAAGAGAGDDLFDRLLGRLNRALGRLLRVPAPDLPALAAKLDLLVAHQVWELDFAEPAMTALKRDAHRLARRAG